LNSIFTPLLVLLTVFAGPYRVVAFRFRSFPAVGLGVVTWGGVLLAFPACVAVYPQRGSWWVAWMALILCAYIQTFVKWCSTAPPLDPASPHCWFGKAELFFAFALIYAADAASGPGGAVFFLAGFACSTAQCLLQRLRQRFEVWTPRDTEWLLAPARTTAAGVSWASPICGRFLFRYGLLLATTIGKALRLFWRRYLAKPTPQPGPPQGYYPPPPQGIVRSFTRYLISHTIFSILTGVIGFNIIGIPFAIMLWFMGWKVGLPHSIKDQARSAISRAKEAISDEKDEVLEKLRLKQEAVEDRLRQERQRIGERYFNRQRQTEGNDFSRHANPPGPRQRADDSAYPRGAILGETPAGGGPPGADAAVRRARQSPRNVPARHANAPASGVSFWDADASASGESLWDIP
jgi:hypothetical protein